MLILKFRIVENTLLFIGGKDSYSSLGTEVFFWNLRCKLSLVEFLRVLECVPCLQVSKIILKTE